MVTKECLGILYFSPKLEKLEETGMFLKTSVLKLNQMYIKKFSRTRASNTIREAMSMKRIQEKVGKKKDIYNIPKKAGH